MKSDENINFDESWKIITVFIGGNDLCQSCKNIVEYFQILFIRIIVI
jgi:phospholipase B1